MSFQTPGGPAAKRRRIEAANATLRKPFRSPLIRQPSQSGPENPQDSPSGRRSSTPASINSTSPATPAPSRDPRPTAASASPSLTASTPGQNKPATLRSKPRRLLPSTAAANKTPLTPSRPGAQPPHSHKTPQDADADEKVALLNRIHHSQKQSASHLRTLQSQLEIVRQARHIEQASFAKRPGQAVDAELRDLTGKWKSASRLAAEELFELVRSRMEGMGGVGAWSEMWRRRRGGYGYGGGFEVEEVGSGGGETNEEEYEGDGRDRDVDQGRGDEQSGESGFTMLTMLKSLNIDPDVLGYDPVEEKWRD
ncbi:hypothetical protein VTI74DRAFT_8180 [Chaetomium olivicolor]